MRQARVGQKGEEREVSPRELEELAIYHKKRVR